MEHDKLPNRKNIRLCNYDYSQSGYYFITICTKDRRKLLWPDIQRSELSSNVGATIGRPQLTDIGEFIEKALANIKSIYVNAFVDDYVIMPDHVHFILVIENKHYSGRPMVAPTVSQIVQQFKGFVAKKFTKDGFSWQKSFYEHIIQDEEDLRLIREYMENNPAEPVDGIIDCNNVRRYLNEFENQIF